MRPIVDLVRLSFYPWAGDKTSGEWSGVPVVRPSAHNCFVQQLDAADIRRTPKIIIERLHYAKY